MSDASTTMPPSNRHSDFPCPFCGCLCDDLELTVAGGRIVEAVGACELARPRLLAAGAESPGESRRAGISPPCSEAIQQAARLLLQARRPLIWGLRRATCAAQVAAVEIAELLRGVIDVPGGGGALDVIGEATATLGEVRQRADLVVVWFAEPLKTHPRLFERYLPMFSGATHPNLIVIGENSAAGWRLPVAAGRDFEAATVLRGLLRQLPLDDRHVMAHTGVPLLEWQRLLERLRQARYGVVLCGESTSLTADEAVAALVRELNEKSRWARLLLRQDANVTGAEQVLTWRTGYPRAVDFSIGYPRSCGDEFSAQRLLERGEVDALLVVCDDPSDCFPAGSAAAERLRTLPIVAVDSQQSECWATAHVKLATAIPGVQSPGTMFRLDGVSLELRPVLNSPLPADFEMLRELAAAVRGM